MSLTLQKGKNYRSGRSGKRTFSGTCGSGSDSSEKYDASLEEIQDSKKLTEKKRSLVSMIPNYFMWELGGQVWRRLKHIIS